MEIILTDYQRFTIGDAENWQCSICGKICENNFPEWRISMYKNIWQHYHGWQISYVDCVFIGKHYVNGKRILKIKGKE